MSVLPVDGELRVGSSSLAGAFRLLPGRHRWHDAPAPVLVGGSRRSRPPSIEGHCCVRGHLRPRWSGMRNPHPTAGPPDGAPLSPAEVQTTLGVDRKALTRWTGAGVIASFRTPGGHRRYRPADVEGLRVKLRASTASRPPGLADDLLGPTEVVRLIGVHPKKHVVRLSNTGKLPVARRTPGSHRRFRPADVEALRVKLQDPNGSQPPEPLPELLGVTEVARLGEIDPKSVTRWSDTGKLPAVMRTPSGHRRWRRTDVDRFLAENPSSSPRGD